MRSVPNEFLESYLPLRVDRYEAGFRMVAAGFLMLITLVRPSPTLEALASIVGAMQCVSTTLSLNRG
jgi:hypothetical protein